MTKIKRILLAFDFKGTTVPAVEKAAYLAERFDSEIVPVHAVEHIPYHHGLNYWHAIHDQIKPQMLKICNELSERGLRVRSPIIKEGRPYDVILSSSNVLDVDVILIGAGKPSFTDSLLGTTAVKIIRNARQLVWVVPLDEKKPAVKKILCAIDLSLASNEVLATATNLSSKLDAKLTVLHVVPKTQKYPGLKKCDLPVVDLDIPSTIEAKTSTVAKNLNKSLQNKMETVFKQYVDSVVVGNVSYKKLIRQGQPEDEILKAVKKEHADLLIMGTVNQKGLTRILVGNITEKVMRKIPCSLVTLRHSGVSNDTELLQKDKKDLLSVEERDSSVDKSYALIEKCYEGGKRHFTAGSYKKAIPKLIKCIEKDEHFYAAYEMLADCYQSLGENEKANKYLEAAKAQRRYIWNLQRSIQKRSV